MWRRSEIWAIRFKDYMLNIHLGHRCRQTTLLEGYHATYSKQKIATLPKSAIGVGIFTKCVQHTSEPFSSLARCC